MEKYNWGVVRSGPTFQALVNTLLRAEHPGLIGFSRSGKDGAQDARSADGRKVWQAKYHSEISGSRLISDAKGELENIQKYKSPEHTRYGQWKDVTEWELVTTDSINPTDQASWDDEIVVRAKQLGLEASYMDRSRIEELLNKHSDIAEAFFGAANRCLLSLGEARDFVSADTIGAEGLKVALVDRESQIDRVKSFLGSDKKLISVVGSGGSGKTRFLLEVGEIGEAAEFQVLWGLEAALAASSTWITGITAEQKTLLLIDEPKEPRLIDQVVEQLKNAGGRLDRWKVVISTRAQKGPILQALSTGNAIAAPQIELLPLDKNAAENLVLKLLNSNPNLVGLEGERKHEIAQHLSGMAHRNPVWMTVAVQVLGRGGRLADLPNDSDGIARLYVNELIENTEVKNCSPQQMDQTAKWLSLCGEIDIEERDTVSYVSKHIPFITPALLVEVLEMLVAKRFAVRRGVKRNVFSIKPDVIREYLVRDWLTTDVDGRRIPSAKSDELVQTVMEIEEGEIVPPLTRILKSVAVLEFSQALGGDDIDLLSPFMAKLMNVAEDGSTIDQEKVIQLVQPFAFARLTEIVELSRTIRLCPRKDEIIKTTLYGDLTLDVTLKHENVVLSLPWLLFGIAPYARSYEETKLLYDELVELCNYECQIADLPEHSGERAKDILPRLFEGRRNYLTSYERAAYDSACTLLSNLRKSATPSRAELKVVEIVLRPFMSLERSETTFDGRGTFTIHQYLIGLTGPEGKRREELISTLQGFAAGNCASPLTRATAWGLLSTARSSAGRVRMQLEAAPDKTNFLLIQHYMKAGLAWVLQTIHTLKNIADLKAARQMWEWHIQFEKDPEVMSLAQQCEEIYQAHRLVKRYHTFFDFQRYKEANGVGISVAAELAQNGANELNTFLSEAREFAGPDFSAHRIIDVSTHLADHWDQRPFISEWIDEALLCGDEDVLQFAYYVVRSRLRVLRASERESDLTRLLFHLFDLLASDAQRLSFLRVEYDRPHPLVFGLMTGRDLNFIQTVITNTGFRILPELKLDCLMGMHYVDEKTVLQVAQGIWNNLPLGSRLSCFLSVLQALDFVDLFKDDYPKLAVTQPIYEWIVALLVDLPDIDDVDDHAMHDFEQFVRRFGKKPIKWVVESIRKRKEMKDSFQAPQSDQIEILPSQNRLPRFCTAITHDGPIDREDRSTIDSLVQMYKSEPKSRFFLLEYLTDVDPTGRVLADLIVAQMADLEEPIGQSVREWSAFAGHYRFNSSAWRKIAIASCSTIPKLTRRDRNAMYMSLCPQGVRSSEFKVGEMDPRYLSDLEQCQRELDSETADELKPFRRWRLDMAQEDYDRAVAEFNAEHED